MTDISLNSEYLQTGTDTVHELVLLHGWGSSREVWRPLLPAIRPWANVTLIDLPGATDSTASPTDFSADDLEALELAILKCAPESAIYVGWSLGGQLAIRLAQRHCHRVSSLVTLCTNPRFIATQEWPGVAAQQFAGFKAGVASDVGACVRRFDSLQARGASRPRSVVRALASARQTLAPPLLLAGLELLESLDSRAVLPQIKQPQLHLFGGSDALVPASVAASLARLLQRVEGARVVSLPGISHAAPLEATSDIAAEIYQFVAGSGSPVTSGERAGEPTKAEVAHSFSRAAHHYDSAAQLQRDVGTRLLANTVGVDVNPSSVLDLGCGTGFFYPQLSARFPGASYLGLDLAEGMVEYARGQFPDANNWLVADAESLPLAANSVDLVFSSLAIQWCPRPQRLFAELARVLTPGGRCVFTSLGPATLKELRTSWAAVDNHQHVNTFLPPALLAESAAAVPGISLQLHTEHFRMEYDRVRELLAELKTIGAHNMNRGRQIGLTSRRTLQGMLAAYESWREAGKLPATYEVLFGTLEKA